jgi:hypothetical protein
VRGEDAIDGAYTTPRRNEFNKALSSQRVILRIVIGGVSLAIACAVAGGALLQITPLASVISIASIGALIALLIKLYNLARDQAMLELIPARYELAIALCQTRADANKLMGEFLAETSSGRGTPARAKT